MEVIEMVVQGLSNHAKLQGPIVWLRALLGSVLLPLVVGDTVALEIYGELGARKVGNFQQPLLWSRPEKW